MKYIVKIGYYNFEFRGGLQALNFAEVARETWANEDEYKNEVLVKVENENENESEEEE